MGMAASQARLLTITARIHDVEYQAQSIQNAKVQLATQSDQVYNDYLEALDAQTLTISTIGADGSKSKIAATFNNLFSVNKVRPADGSNYALRDEKGKLVVEDSVHDAYEEFEGKDPYLFAIYMLGGENAKNDIRSLEELYKAEEALYINKKDNDDENGLSDDIKKMRESLEKYVGGPDIYDNSKVKEEDKKDYETTLANYREALYKKFAKEICTDVELNCVGINGSATVMSEAQYNADKFENYIDIFNQIKMCGGCVPISDYNGMFGDASNNSEWLTSMIQCGKFTIDTFSKDKNGKMTMNGTSPSSDSCLSYTETTSIDSTAAKKAEAKYEHDLKEIDKKDKKYDMTLSKLETERTALTTEYDSVKKVIQDNIDRTFGIFS